MSRFDVRELRRRRRETGTNLRRRLLPTVTAVESRALLSTLTVSNTDDSGTGSLRAAITQANTDGGGDTIGFSSLFNSAQTIALTSGQLTLSNPATTSIVGPGADLLNISGGGMLPVVLELAKDATAQISGLSVSGASGGSGVLNLGGTLEMNSCVISGNSGFDGSGIYNETGSSLALTGCSISFNSGIGRGGGIYNGESASATITDCLINNNGSVNRGGGIYSGPSATVNLKNVTITGNSAGSQGGGFCASTRTLR